MNISKKWGTKALTHSQVLKMSVSLKNTLKYFLPLVKWGWLRTQFGPSSSGGSSKRGSLSNFAWYWTNCLVSCGPSDTVDPLLRYLPFFTHAGHLPFQTILLNKSTIQAKNAHKLPLLFMQLELAVPSNADRFCVFDSCSKPPAVFTVWGSLQCICLV